MCACSIPKMIEQGGDVVGVVGDIFWGRHRSHQLATKIAANDPIVLCKRSRHHLPGNRRHGDPVEEHQWFAGAVTQMKESDGITLYFAHSAASPVGISKSTDLAAIKALSAGKKISGRSM